MTYRKLPYFIFIFLSFCVGAACSHLLNLEPAIHDIQQACQPSSFVDDESVFNDEPPKNLTHYLQGTKSKVTNVDKVNFAIFDDLTIDLIARVSGEGTLEYALKKLNLLDSNTHDIKGLIKRIINAAKNHINEKEVPDVYIFPSDNSEPLSLETTIFNIEGLDKVFIHFENIGISTQLNNGVYMKLYIKESNELIDFKLISVKTLGHDYIWLDYSWEKGTYLVEIFSDIDVRPISTTSFEII